MNCHEFEQRINELLDGRSPLQGDPALEAHARHCDACRSLLSAYRRLAQVELWPAHAPDVRDAVCVAVARDEPVEVVPLRTFGAAAWRRLAFAAAAACAAVVLVSYSVWTAMELANSPQTAVPVVQGGSTGAGQRVEASSAPAIPDLAQTAADSYRQLAQETGKSLSDVAALVPSVEETAPLPAAQAGENASRLAPNVVEGLKPVTRSTAGTLSLLMRVIPPPTKAPPATRPKPEPKKG
jgi:hypothetical protein